RARATAALVSRRVRSSSTRARSRSAVARVTSPPLQLKSGKGSENPITGSTWLGFGLVGSPLSKPNWKLGAKRLGRVKVSERSAERKRAVAAATGRYSPGGGLTGNAAVSFAAASESTSAIAVL